MENKKEWEQARQVVRDSIKVAKVTMNAEQFRMATEFVAQSDKAMADFAAINEVCVKKESELRFAKREAHAAKLEAERIRTAASNLLKALSKAGGEPPKYCAREFHELDVVMKGGSI